MPHCEPIGSRNWGDSKEKLALEGLLGGYSSCTWSEVKHLPRKENQCLSKPSLVVICQRKRGVTTADPLCGWGTTGK